MGWEIEFNRNDSELKFQNMVFIIISLFLKRGENPLHLENDI